ncbi:MAG: sensor histidine kinase [Armatimonadota bacterium]
MGAPSWGQEGGRATFLDEASLLARIAERQSSLAASLFEQAAEAERASAEKRELAGELAGSLDRIQELHHRVRNQLQTVTGLLSAQELTEHSPTARRALRSSVGRLTSFAAIHDLLAQKPASESLPFASLASRLSHQLLHSLAADGRVSLRTELEEVSLNSRRGTALALVAAELVANAIEHGFPEGASGEIVLSLASSGGAVTLEVRDNGVGLPDGFDPGGVGGLGLRVVSRLVQRDLAGSLSAENAGGTVFRVRFPLQGQE